MKCTVCILNTYFKYLYLKYYPALVLCYIGVDTASSLWMLVTNSLNVVLLYRYGR